MQTARGQTTVYTEDRHESARGEFSGSDDWVLSSLCRSALLNGRIRDDCWVIKPRAQEARDHGRASTDLAVPVCGIDGI